MTLSGVLVLVAALAADPAPVTLMAEGYIFHRNRWSRFLPSSAEDITGLDLWCW